MIDKAQRYKLMSHTISPRPIAWIVTEHEKTVNLAPFSYFIPVSSKPAIVAVSIGEKTDGTIKDTLANILESKKCTICLPALRDARNVTLSAEALEREESEVEKFDIKTELVFEDFPPIISDIRAAIFCKLYQIIDIKDSANKLVLLEIEKLYSDDRIADDEGRAIFEQLGRTGKSYIHDYKITHQDDLS